MALKRTSNAMANPPPELVDGVRHAATRVRSAARAFAADPSAALPTSDTWRAAMAQGVASASAAKSAWSLAVGSLPKSIPRIPGMGNVHKGMEAVASSLPTSVTGGMGLVAKKVAAPARAAARAVQSSLQNSRRQLAPEAAAVQQDEADDDEFEFEFDD